MPSLCFPKSLGSLSLASLPHWRKTCAYFSPAWFCRHRAAPLAPGTSCLHVQDFRFPSRTPAPWRTSTFLFFPLIPSPELQFLHVFFFFLASTVVPPLGWGTVAVCHQFVFFCTFLDLWTSVGFSFSYAGGNPMSFSPLVRDLPLPTCDYHSRPNGYRCRRPLHAQLFLEAARDLFIRR